MISQVDGSEQTVRTQWCCSYVTAVGNNVKCGNKTLVRDNDDAEERLCNVFCYTHSSERSHDIKDLGFFLKQ